MKSFSAIIKLCGMIVFIVLFTSNVFSSDIPDKAGTSGLAFLKIGVGARASGMGEAFTAISGDIYSQYWNPAGIAQHREFEFAFMHNEWVQDINLEYAAFCFDYKKNVFGIGLTVSQVSELERREGPTEEPLSYFDTHDLSFAIIWGRSLKKNIDFGLSAKLLYEKIDFSSATGLGFDFGGIYYLRPELQFGAAILNLGAKMKLEEDKFSLPTQFKIGAAYSGHENYFAGDYILSLDLVKPRDNDLKIHLGGEYTYNKMFSLRSGYQIGYDDRGFSLGLGMKIRKYSIDYAFIPFSSDLGNSHRLSVNLKI